MTELSFYRLESSSLDSVIPRLLEKVLERGWKALIKTGTEKQLDHLNEVLWVYSEDSFLPHSADPDWFPEEQKIFLTSGDINLNGAEVLFLVDGAFVDSIDDYERVICLFCSSRQDHAAVADTIWKGALEKGYPLACYAQDEHGRWIGRECP